MNTPCLKCDQPVADTCFVCERCGKRLATLLVDLGGLMDDLDDRIGRRFKFRDQASSRGGDASLPVDLEAIESADVVRNVLTTWTRHIVEETGDTMPETWDAIGDYLARHVLWLRQRADGGEAIDELTDALTVARRAVDRPADRIYCGPCPSINDDGTRCGTALVAAPGRDVAICSGCGARHDIDQRRAALINEAKDFLLPAVDVARAISGLGMNVTLKAVEHWIARQQLTPRGSTADNKRRPTYRVGDAIDLALDSMTRVKR